MFKKSRNWDSSVLPWIQCCHHFKFQLLFTSYSLWSNSSLVFRRCFRTIWLSIGSLSLVPPTGKKNLTSFSFGQNENKNEPFFNCFIQFSSFISTYMNTSGCHLGLFSISNLRKDKYQITSWEIPSVKYVEFYLPIKVSKSASYYSKLNEGKYCILLIITLRLLQILIPDNC